MLKFASALNCCSSQGVVTFRKSILNSFLSFMRVFSKIYSGFLIKKMGIFSSKATATDMASPVAVLVKEMVNSDNVVIFSKTYCPYCKMAKEVFDKLQQKYTTVELDKHEDAEAIQMILGELTGAKTVPRVFVNGECLGGGSDVKALYDNGKLQKYFE